MAILYILKIILIIILRITKRTEFRLALRLLGLYWIRFLSIRLFTNNTRLETLIRIQRRVERLKCLNTKYKDQVIKGFMP